jgi:hypothetical protein
MSHLPCSTSRRRICALESLQGVSLECRSASDGGVVVVVDSAAAAGAAADASAALPRAPSTSSSCTSAVSPGASTTRACRQSCRSSVPARSGALGMIGIPCLRAHTSLLHDPCTWLRGVRLCFLALHLSCLGPCSCGGLSARFAGGSGWPPRTTEYFPGGRPR